MISTIMLHEGQPTLPLPARVLDGLGLHPGQRVRIEIHGLPTPVLESDGTPAWSKAFD